MEPQVGPDVIASETVFNAFQSLGFWGCGWIRAP